MFAIFSFIQDTPQIYQIHSHEETCKKNIEELVKRYIIQNRNFETQDPLTIELDKIKLDTFSQLPAYTFLKTNEQTFDIYKHEVTDKIEKGWVWNGSSKVVNSNKIGYFQIQKVLENNIVEPEIFPDEITEEQLQMYQDIENMIDEMLRSIEQGNEQLDLEREEIQKLPDVPIIQTQSTPSPCLSPSCLSPSCLSPSCLSPSCLSRSPSSCLASSCSPSIRSSPIKRVYNVRYDPLQENIKTNLIEIESKLLPFQEEIEDTNTESLDETQEEKLNKFDETREKRRLCETEEEPMDLCDVTSTFAKCNWTQRGMTAGNRNRRRNYSNRRGSYIPSQGYSFAKLHLY